MLQSEKYYLFFHEGRLDGDACQVIYCIHFHQGWEVAEPAQLSVIWPTWALLSPRGDRLRRNRSCTRRHGHHLVHGFPIARGGHRARRAANEWFLCYTTPFGAGWWLSWGAWLRGSLHLLQYMRKRCTETVLLFVFCCILSLVSVPQGFPSLTKPGELPGSKYGVGKKLPRVWR